MFHAPIHTPPTPIAAQAIIAQIAARAALILGLAIGFVAGGAAALIFI